MRRCTAGGGRTSSSSLVLSEVSKQTQAAQGQRDSAHRSRKQLRLRAPRAENSLYSAGCHTAHWPRGIFWVLQTALQLLAEKKQNPVGFSSLLPQRQNVWLFTQAPCNPGKAVPRGEVTAHSMFPSVLLFAFLLVEGTMQLRYSSYVFFSCPHPDFYRKLLLLLGFVLSTPSPENKKACKVTYRNPQSDSQQKDYLRKGSYIPLNMSAKKPPAPSRLM